MRRSTRASTASCIAATACAGVVNGILLTCQYTVWSDVFTCPKCAGEVVFWNAAVDKDAGQVRDEFPCPHCAKQLTKRTMGRTWVTKFDTAI